MQLAVQIPASKFDFDPQGRAFMADISEIEHAGHSAFGLLFPDCGEIGFELIHNTEVVPFRLVNTAKDGDGDVECWTFAPVPSIYHAESIGTRVILFND